MIEDVCRGFYPYYLPLVLLGIAFRIYEKKWSRAETVLLLIYLVHEAGMIFQISFFHGAFSRRYFLTVSPLLFGWAGYAVFKLLKIRLLRWLLPVGCAFLLFDSLRPALEYHWKSSKREKYFVLQKMSAVIRADWGAGESLYKPEITCYRYRSPRRPLVQCENNLVLGYASGGSAYLFEENASIPPDYKVFIDMPVTSPFVEIHQERCFGKTYRIGKMPK